MTKGPERYMELTNTKTGKKKMVRYGDPKWFDNSKPLEKATPAKRTTSDGYMVRERKKLRNESTRLSAGEYNDRAVALEKKTGRDFHTGKKLSK